MEARQVLAKADVPRRWGRRPARVAQSEIEDRPRAIRWGLSAVNLLAFLGVWEVAARTLDVPSVVLPPFSAVLGEFAEMQMEGILVDALMSTLSVYAVGMLLAILVAVPMGIVLGGVPLLNRLVAPYLWLAYTVPREILLPIVLLWFGFGMSSRLVLVVVSAVPAIAVVVLDGVQTVNSVLVAVARAFGAKRRDVFRFVVLPSTVPYIGTGVRMGMARGLIGLFLAELFTASEGIGFVIVSASRDFKTARVLAMLSLFIMLSVSLIGVSRRIERSLSRWKGAVTV